MDPRVEEFCFLNSPLGWLKIEADERGLTSISFLSEPPRTLMTVTLPHLKEAYRQLAEYFRGERLRFNLPLNPRGSDLERSVWEKLADVPFGTAVSYDELASLMGLPGGARAVGIAHVNNPLPIVVPCHRLRDPDAGDGATIRSRLLEFETSDV